MDFLQLHFKSIDSTNTYAKKHFADLPDATLVSADEQTAGRGRLDRKWISPPGVNIYASFLMKKIERPFYATIVASLAVLRTLRAFYPEGAFYIKWPNDIYCGDAKIAGILSECIPLQEQKIGVIAGMGVNVNLSRSVLEKIDQKASSLAALAGREFNLIFFRSELAKALLKCYIHYSTFPERLFSEWKAENALIGRILAFEKSDGSLVKAKICDIGNDGELFIDDGLGVSTFHCGDLRILKESLSLTPGGCVS